MALSPVLSAAAPLDYKKQREIDGYFGPPHCSNADRASYGKNNQQRAHWHEVAT